MSGIRIVKSTGQKTPKQRPTKYRGIYGFSIGLSILIGMAGCNADHSDDVESETESHTPPAFLVGEFEDDYAGRFTISDTEWLHHPVTRYLVEEWVSEEQYLVARNDPNNPADGGLWTRIDWVGLEGMEPWNWAFCFSAFDETTMDAARGVEVVDRENPRTGCNGFPFSRMKRVEE